MSLHVESHGRGADLVMVHGWGMHSGIWGGCVGRLAKRYRVTLVDLPGHGRSPWSPAAMDSLRSLAAAVSGEVPAPAVWLGWSLGGLVALQAAADLPQRMTGLVLVATNASFVRRPGWRWGQTRAILNGFAADLSRDYRGVLRRFLALQARGSEAAHHQLRLLRERLFLHGEPDPEALRAGLGLLTRSDLRDRLPSIDRPTLLVAGENDALVPPQAAVGLAAQLPDGRLERFANAGHAPFLSDPERFCSVVESFIDERLSSG